MNENATPTGGPEPAKQSSARISSRFSQRRTRRKTAILWSLVAVGCVAAGVVIGAGVVFLYFSHKGFPHPPKPDEMVDRIMIRLDNPVTLTADEKTRCRDIVARHMEEVNRIRKESFGTIRNQFEAMREEVGVVLGPERHNKWETEIQKNWPRRKPDRGNDHDGGRRHDDGH